MKSRNESKIVRISGKVLDYIEVTYPDSDGKSLDAILRDLFGLEHHNYGRKKTFIKRPHSKAREMDELPVGEAMLVSINEERLTRSYIKGAASMGKEFEYQRAGDHFSFLKRLK